MKQHTDAKQLLNEIKSLIPSGIFQTSHILEGQSVVPPLVCYSFLNFPTPISVKVMKLTTFLSFPNEQRYQPF